MEHGPWTDSRFHPDEIEALGLVGVGPYDSYHEAVLILLSRIEELECELIEVERSVFTTVDCQDCWQEAVLWFPSSGL